MKILVSTPAAASDAKDRPITQAAEFKKLAGLEAKDDVCSQFLDGRLATIGLTGGALKIVFDAKEKGLRVETVYESPRKLTSKELAQLCNLTSGLCSDLISDGCFAKVARKKKVAIQPAPKNDDRKVRIEQIDDGRPAEPKRSKREFPFFKAAQSGDLEKLEALITRGEDLEARDKYDNTPLISAIIYSQTDAALLLIERGADVDARGKNGATPAMWAANRSATKVLKGLIKAGCDLNLKDTEQHNSGKTALMYAADLGIVQLLLKHGADPNVRNAQRKNAGEYYAWQAAAFKDAGDKRDAARYTRMQALLLFRKS